MLLDFAGNSKPAKVRKRSTIIAPVSEGGLDMVDIYNVHSASKVSWMKRLHAKWKKVMLNK